MSSKLQFSYDQETRKLVIDDDGIKHVYILSDSKSEIFYYILKAIDLLDDGDPGSGGDVADWALKGNEDKIPESKYDLQHIEQEVKVQPTQVFEDAKEIETSDPAEDAKYVYVGGRA